MSTATVETLRPAEPVKEAAPRKRLPFSLRTLIIVGAAIVLAVAGGVYITLPPSSVSTEAAYVEADSSIVSTRVRGVVAEILVRDNEKVRIGQPLVRLDDEEFAAREASAKADVQTAEAAVLAARAAFSEHAAQEKLAGSDVDASSAAIVAAEAEAHRAAADQERFDRLAGAGAASKRDVDLARATAASASAEVVRLKAKLGVSSSQAAAVTARRETLTASLAEAEAAAARAKASLDLAQQDRAHTLILSPINGVAGDRKANVGDYVQPGSRLITVVPTGTLYVTANFKETQVSRMLPGQHATIEVDALPGTRFTGKVESFAPGSGSQFALIPFEPGTGNFTKVVQRVPVRIAIDAGQAGFDRLRPGLSTRVEVKLD